MKAYVLLFALALSGFCSLFAQNTPDINLHFNHKIVNCPTQPDIATSFSLSSADNMAWNVGFIMLTLTVDEAVLGAPPQINNVPAGWNTDVYKQGGQWQIEMVEPNGNHLVVGTNEVEFFSLNWPYIQEGTTYSITIDDADLGVNNSTLDEQIHYPDGLFISGNDDCASQVGEIDLYWYDPVLSNCLQTPTMSTVIELASHVVGETWDNNFIQFIFQQDNSILGKPRAINLLPSWTADVFPMYADYWVIEVSSPNNETITENPLKFFDIEWDVLQENTPFTIVKYDIDLGLNVPNEIVHFVNGTTIAGNANCPCDIELKNVSTICNDACKGLSEVYFDLQVMNASAGNIELFFGSDSRVIPHAGGDLIYLDESFAQLTFTQPTQLIARMQGTDCGDTLLIQPPDCGPCEININSATPSACELPANTYSVTLDVSTKELCNGLVKVKFDATQATQMTIYNNVLTLTDLPADGANHTITIWDDILGNLCSDAIVYAAPPSCLMSANHTIALEEDAVVRLYPNPVNVNHRISIESESVIEALYVHSIDGKIRHTNLHPSLSKTIDTRDWSTGIYFVNILTDKGQVNKKIVIQE